MGLRVLFHPTFDSQIKALHDGASTSDEMLGWYEEIMSLVGALNKYGRVIEGTDVSHPIVTSRKYEAHCLRRHPANVHAQTAVKPPTLRIPYVWFNDKTTGDELAAIFMIGDKTNLGNDWYPIIVEQLTSHLVPDWEQQYPNLQAKRAKR